MGQFYQTTQSDIIDNKMLQLPYELMGKVLLQNDKNIDDTKNEIGSLYDKLEADALDADKKELSETLGDFESRINTLSEDLQQNPIEYRRKLSDINKLGRDMYKEWKYGKVAAIQNRYDKDIQWWKEAKELQNKNPELYTDEYLRKLRELNIMESGTVDYKDPSDYKSYQENPILGLENLPDWVDKKLKDALPDLKSIKRDDISGQYIIKRGSSVEYMSENDLNNILTNSLNASPEMQSALLQRNRLGLSGFENLVDPKTGELVSASEVKEVETIDKNGRIVKSPQLIFNSNILGSAFKAGVEKYGFIKETNESGIRENRFALQEHSARLRKKEKEDKDRIDDAVEVVTKGVMTTFGGKNAEEYQTAVSSNDQKIQNSKDNISRIVRSELEIPDNQPIPKEIQDMIDKGNFTGLYDYKNQKGLIEINSDVIEDWQRQYNLDMMEKAGLQARRQEWENEKEAEWNRSNKGYTLDEYIKYNEPDWNNHLSNTSENSVNVRNTWADQGIKMTTVKKLRDEIVKSGLYEVQPIESDTPISIKDNNNKDVLINGKTIAELVSLGLIERETIRVPYQEKTSEGRKTSSGNYIPPTYETRYRFTDGSGYVNFSTSPESILPPTTYDDNKNRNLGMLFKIKDTQAFVRIPNVTTTSQKIFNQLNRDDLDITYMLQKLPKTKEIIIPGGHGIKIQNNKTELYIPGSMTKDGTPDILNINSKQARDILKIYAL